MTEYKIPSIQTQIVVKDIVQERTNQIDKGWTPEHDLTHNVGDMIQLVTDRLVMGFRLSPTNELSIDRHRLVQAATLLVATIEMMDRRERGGNLPQQGKGEVDEKARHVDGGGSSAGSGESRDA